MTGYLEISGSNGFEEKEQPHFSNICISKSSKKGWRGGFRESVYIEKNLK